MQTKHSKYFLIDGKTKQAISNSPRWFQFQPPDHNLCTHEIVSLRIQCLATGKEQKE